MQQSTKTLALLRRRLACLTFPAADAAGAPNNAAAAAFLPIEFSKACTASPIDSPITAQRSLHHNSVQQGFAGTIVRLPGWSAHNCSVFSIHSLGIAQKSHFAHHQIHLQRGFAAFVQLPNTTDALNIDAIAQAEHAAEIAAVAAAKAESFMTVGWFIDALDYVHTSTGWPWWAAIAALNMSVRLLTFPVIVFVQKSSVKAMALSQEMRRLKQLQEAATKAPTLKEYEVLQKRFLAESQEVMSKHGSSMRLTLLSPVLTMVNAGVFISFFSALSNLVKEKIPSMTHEGLFWFTDLTVPDPYFGLPFICCAATLAMVELGAVQNEMMMQGNTAQVMKWFMRGLSFLFIPAGKYVASAVGIMWVSNSIVAIIQSRVLANPGLRAKLGLPDMNHMREAMSKSLTQIRQGTSVSTGPPALTASQIGSAVPPAPGTPASLGPIPHKPKLFAHKPKKNKPKA